MQRMTDRYTYWGNNSERAPCIVFDSISMEYMFIVYTTSILIQVSDVTNSLDYKYKNIATRSEPI